MENRLLFPQTRPHYPAHVMLTRHWKPPGPTTTTIKQSPPPQTQRKFCSGKMSTLNINQCLGLRQKTFHCSLFIRWKINFDSLTADKEASVILPFD